MEDLELLKAAIAVAVADGTLRRSERGVVEGLARRAGVGETSYHAMLEAAKTDRTFGERIHMPPDKARRAIVLLVSQARIDGEISAEERRVIVRIANDIGVMGDEFREAWEEGIRRADTIRDSRG